MRIAVLGTGMTGRTIATKLAQIGHQVMMGSRRIGDEKAVEWMKNFAENASYGTFSDAARFGDIVFNCTTGISGFQTLKRAGRENLKGKILIHVTKPLDFPTGMPPLPANGQNNPGSEPARRRFLRSRAALALLNIVREVSTFKRRWSQA
jgi:8-hydroxy-5-deazaflavin:NADPH oxidoreductase